MDSGISTLFKVTWTAFVTLHLISQRPPVLRAIVALSLHQRFYSTDSRRILPSVRHLANWQRQVALKD